MVYSGSLFSLCLGNCYIISQHNPYYSVNDFKYEVERGFPASLVLASDKFCMGLTLIRTNTCGDIKYFSQSKNRYVR